MWEARFDKPIRLSTGKAVHTLRDAAEHVIALPPMETKQGHWQNALACLLAAAERSGPVKIARIAMLKALASGKDTPERAFTGRSEPWDHQMKSVWVYVDISRQVGDLNHLQVFANPEAADQWLPNMIRKASRLNTRFKTCQCPRRKADKK